LHDITADSAAARPLLERRLEATGTDTEDLLVRFLEEAHYAFEGEGLLFHTVDVERLEPPDAATGRPGHVRATARGEPFDRVRHELRRPVKAITYHGVEVVPTAAGYRATVILDL
jgi:SHS2 domain-containing protein